ncbi:MAG TPA: methyltransferase domain-containing protein, partial [Acidimicrobiales bacterium]|nr:methyltransferase domain-containing protein [Acidimicrobiales bacterium]
MNGVDRYLRDRRVEHARRHIPPGARVLDVGCFDGALFQALGAGIGPSIGIDEELVGPVEADRYRLVPGRFPDDLPADAGRFDVVTMLALFEHIPTADQDTVVAACRELLQPGGLVVLTVPSPAVDPMLDVMAKLRIIDGLSHDQHHGFKPADLEPLFARHGFVLERHKRFQLGLNNLFVFRA